MTNQEALKSIVEDGINLGAGDYVELEALVLAKEALEKQIPKKPIIVGDGIHHYDFDGKCPNCGRGLYEEEHHCKCGQSLDWWSEELDNFQYYTAATERVKPNTSHGKSLNHMKRRPMPTTCNPLSSWQAEVA